MLSAFIKPAAPRCWSGRKFRLVSPGRARHVSVTPRLAFNFVDVYIRKGLYPVPLPSGLGTEAAGIVQEIGPGVTEVKVGDRIAYMGGPLGAYAEERLVPADRLVALPPGISDVQAAAMMLKGLTTQYLIRQIFRVKQGDIILFHAAAGGVGVIACPWAKSLGATLRVGQMWHSGPVFCGEKSANKSQK
jgi:NADPH:quinone reductase